MMPPQRRAPRFRMWTWPATMLKVAGWPTMEARSSAGSGERAVREMEKGVETAALTAKLWMEREAPPNARESTTVDTASVPHAQDPDLTVDFQDKPGQRLPDLGHLSFGAR